MNNPPAFPKSEGVSSIGNSGMSLRDYFAAAAMQGRLSNPRLLQTMEESGVPPETIPAFTAKHAYAFADGMLAQREKESA